MRLGQRITDPVSGAAASAAESYLDQRVEEDWAGLTIARPLSASVGVGLTWYGVYRGQRTRKELSLQAVGASQTTQTALGVVDFEYSHYRTLAKLGVAWQTPKWHAGFSVTTPSLAAFGGGKSAYTLSLAGIDANGDGQPEPPVLVTDTQDGLDSSYKSSWALGAGIARRGARTRLYASAEWYAPVGRFEVIQLPEGAPGASGLTQQLKGVLNAGLGFEHVLTEDVSVYGAFHTDYSASEGSARQNVAISDWDLYHFSGGLSFRFRDNRFTLGASWARGSTTRAARLAGPPRPAAPGAPGPGRRDPLFEDHVPARVRFRELTWGRERRGQRAGWERQPCSSPCRALPRQPRRRSTSWCSATAAASSARSAR